MNEYNDVNMLNSLVQKNIRYGVSIDEIVIDMGTIPVTGKILFTQTGYRARGKISRKVEAEFSIYDVSRSEENAHGAKIEDWIVHYSAPIEDNQEEYNNTQPENLTNMKTNNFLKDKNKLLMIIPIVLGGLFLYVFLFTTHHQRKLRK